MKLELCAKELEEVVKTPVERLSPRQKIKVWAFANAYTLIFMSAFFAFTDFLILIKG